MTSIILTAEDATILDAYEAYEAHEESILAALAREEEEAWVALSVKVTFDYEPDLDDYEYQQSFYSR